MSDFNSSVMNWNQCNVIFPAARLVAYLIKYRFPGGKARQSNVMVTTRLLRWLITGMLPWQKSTKTEVSQLYLLYYQTQMNITAQFD